MTIYVEYEGYDGIPDGDFSYESSIAPRKGDTIIYEEENEGITSWFLVKHVSHYTNGGYNEIHIRAGLKEREVANE
jgi:hypothetical protein